MNALTTLQEKALVASAILNTLNPSSMHFTKSNQVIFGNYNQDKFEVPNKHKKHFGNQAILTAIAKVNGYTTYKSLLEDPKPKLKPSTLELALKSLNPYPLSEIQTARWKRYIDCINYALYLGPLLESSTYQNLKKHEETPYLNFFGHGMPNYFYILQISEFQRTRKKAETPYCIISNKSFASFSGLVTVAESIYLTALRKPLTRVMKESYNPTPRQSVNNTFIDHFTAGFKCQPFPFKECLNQEEWNEPDFKGFVKALQDIFENLFSAKLSISGRQRNPLEKIVTVEFKDGYASYKSDIKLKKLHETKQLLEKLQEAAIALRDEAGEDNTLYTHPEIQNPSNSDILKNDELKYSIISNLNSTKPTDSTQTGLKGTKQFWINIAPSILPYKLGKPELEIQEIIQIIKEDVLDRLQPLNKENLKDKKHQYHFKLKVDRTLEFKEEWDLIPTYMTICSDYPITKEIALLMVHAEIFKISNSDEKYYGDPNLFVGFSISSFNLQVSDLENPENYDNLIKVKISRIKEPAVNSYYIEFKPEAIIESMSINTFDNEEDELTDIDYSKLVGIRLTLMDTIIKKKLSHKHMSVSDITFKVFVNIFDEIEYQPFKYEDEKRLSKLGIYHELAIEQLFLNQRFLRPMVKKFISITQERLSTLSQETIERMGDIHMSSYQAISYPFSEHYVKNKQIDSMTLDLI